VAQAYDKARYGKTGEDESRLYNELEISVLRATGLPLGPDDAAPTAYVHFQFLGNPDKFTNPVQATRDPEFNERFVFPMMTNDQQLRLLSRSKLQLTVVDLNGEENADDADDAGLIGDIFVALNDVADGQSINDKFTLKSAAHGNPVGALQIAVRWRHPFRRQRELGPRSLSGLETETLIKAFSDGEVAAGLVNYRDFCRFIDPPRDVLRAIERLRAFATRMGEKEHRKPREIFKILLEKFDAMKVDTFVAKLLKVRDPFYLNTAACFAGLPWRMHNAYAPVPHNCPHPTPPTHTQPTKHFISSPLQVDPEIRSDELSKLFEHIDMDGDGVISFAQLEAVLNLDDVAGISAALQVRALSHRPPPPQLPGPYPCPLFSPVLNHR